MGAGRLGYLSGRDYWLTRLVFQPQNDEKALSLMPANPFPERPPRFVRALLYEYRFTTPAERRLPAGPQGRNMSCGLNRARSVPDHGPASRPV